MIDNFAESKKSVCIAPQDASSSINGTGIDLQGYNACTFDCSLVLSTADGSNYIDLKIQESDDDSTYSAVAVANLVGLPVGTTSLTTGIFKSVQTTTTGAVYSIGYVGTKQYVRVISTVTGTIVGVLGVNAILGGAANGPATAKDSAITVSA